MSEGLLKINYAAKRLLLRDRAEVLPPYVQRSESVNVLRLSSISLVVLLERNQQQMICRVVAERAQKILSIF